MANNMATNFAKLLKKNCPIHNLKIKFVCPNNDCIQNMACLMCNDCRDYHPSEHLKELFPLYEVFSAAVIEDAEERINQDELIRNGFGVGQMNTTKLDAIFDQLESDTFSILHNARKHIKEKWFADRKNDVNGGDSDQLSRVRNELILIQYSIFSKEFDAISNNDLQVYLTKHVEIHNLMKKKTPPAFARMDNFTLETILENVQLEITKFKAQLDSFYTNIQYVQQYKTISDNSTMLSPIIIRSPTGALPPDNMQFSTLFDKLAQESGTPSPDKFLFYQGLIGSDPGIYFPSSSPVPDYFAGNSATYLRDHRSDDTITKDMYLSSIPTYAPEKADYPITISRSGISKNSSINHSTISSEKDASSSRYVLKVPSPAKKYVPPTTNYTDTSCDYAYTTPITDFEQTRERQSVVTAMPPKSNTVKYIKLASSGRSGVSKDLPVATKTKLSKMGSAQNITFGSAPNISVPSSYTTDNTPTASKFSFKKENKPVTTITQDTLNVTSPRFRNVATTVVMSKTAEKPKQTIKKPVKQPSRANTSFTKGNEGLNGVTQNEDLSLGLRLREKDELMYRMGISICEAVSETVGNDDDGRSTVSGKENVSVSRPKSMNALIIMDSKNSQYNGDTDTTILYQRPHY
jgi:hypothetical protein